MYKTLFFLWIGFSCVAQQEKSNNIFRPELMLGKSIPSYELFTGKNPQFVLGASFEHKNNNNAVEWQTILNNPVTGIGVFYTNYGTKTKGQSLSVLPFIAFHPIRNYKWTTKFGMGISYFDTLYHPIKNPENKAISAHLTWAIQGFLYYDTAVNKTDLRFGIGVFHHSNGHTKLPNEGLNSALLSISTNFNLTPKKYQLTPLFDKDTIKKYGDYYYSFRIGNGIQAFVTEDSPLKSVYIASISGGFLYKNIVKIGIGINYRFYQHYYDYIKIHQLKPFIDNPTKNASNINLTIGAEVLLGKIGIDWEGGINVYKPFYETHFNLQKTKSKYKLKKLFLGRLGLKLYAINTKKKPKTNYFVAAHINSNLSQADYSELSFGLVHRLFRK